MPTSEDGRITLAIIEERLSALTVAVTSLIKKMDESLNKQAERLDGIDQRVTRNEVKINDLDRLKTAVVFGAIGLVTVLIATIVALVPMITP